MLNVLMFTPTLPERITNPFLEPCRFRRKQIETRHWLDVMENSEQGPLGPRYEAGRQAALENGCDFMFIIEDDERPPVDILVKFLATKASVVCGIKQLRPDSAKGFCYTPLIWHFKEEDVINSPMLSVSQVRPGSQKDPFPFRGTVSSPCLIDLSLNIPFRSRPSGQGSRIVDDGWDIALSEDLEGKGIRPVCCPQVVTEHFCLTTQQVYV